MEGSFTPFGAQSVLLTQGEGVPEAIYGGIEAADEIEAEKVSASALEKQLEVEASMHGIEDSHLPRKVWNVQVTDAHFSSMPDWDRREWRHDPFYGWRTQEESKVPMLPAVKKALEAERQAAIEARKNKAHLAAEGINVASDPFMAQELTLFESLRPRRLDEPYKEDKPKRFQANHGITITSIEAKERLSNAIRSNNPDELSAAIKECRNANALAPAKLSADLEVGPSWHDAKITERILAASHIRGDCLAQDEATKQQAIIDHNLPVGLFTGAAPQQASGPMSSPLPPPSAAASAPSAEALDPMRTWTSVPSRVSMVSQAPRPSGSRASTAMTAATERLPYGGNSPDPYDYYHTSKQLPKDASQFHAGRTKSAGPSMKTPPGPLWFLGL
jgi:hypothetical protein